MNISNKKTMKQIAKQLVKDNILGTRKGLPTPRFQHSLNVGQTLETLGFNENVVLAGMLHDTLEDSSMTVEDLQAYGFDNSVIELVKLCTHDDSIKNKDARWIHMIGRIIDRKSDEALAIKMADLLDNLKDCHSLSESRRDIMRGIKVKNLILVSNEVDSLSTLNSMLANA
jgi:(p)ppGpp synthase/HD superfamily hydrolase